MDDNEKNNPIEWVCTCGASNSGNFCCECGNVKPDISDSEPVVDEVQVDEANTPVTGDGSMPVQEVSSIAEASLEETSLEEANLEEKMLNVSNSPQETKRKKSKKPLIIILAIVLPILLIVGGVVSAWKLGAFDSILGGNSDYEINEVPSKVKVPDIPKGYAPYSVDKWDMSFCYPKTAEIDYSKKKGVDISISDDEAIKIKLIDDSMDPDTYFEELYENLQDDYSKLKMDEVSSMSVGKKTLYYCTFTEKKSDVIDVAIEIYEDFIIEYRAVSTKSGSLDSVLVKISESIVFEKDAYGDVEEIDITEPSTSEVIVEDVKSVVITDDVHNMSLCIPETFTNEECPVGIYASNGNNSVGALYLNNDPIDSCVYDAEDLLTTLCIYDGMFESLIYLDDASIGNYYDSNFNGTPEIDAEFTGMVNGVNVTGYMRMIDGPEIGSYIVFYVAEDEETANDLSVVIETFATNGSPSETTFVVYKTDFNLRYVLPDYEEIEVQNTENTSIIYFSNSALQITKIGVTEITPEEYVNSYCSTMNDSFGGSTTREGYLYDAGRYETYVSYGSCTIENIEYTYYGVAVTLQDDEMYVVTCALPDEDLEEGSVIVDYLIWSFNLDI